MEAVGRIGLEAGAMSAWLFGELKKLGLPMICLEAFQANQFLKTHRNKTDKNDARGLTVRPTRALARWYYQTKGGL
jgi:transposase